MTKDKIKGSYNKGVFIHAILAEDTDDITLHYKPGALFADVTMDRLIGLGDILKKIHNQHGSEGWIIKEGVFTSPDG